jgi:hypothetical protein
MHKTLLWAGFAASVAALVWLEAQTCKRKVRIAGSYMCAENLDHQSLKTLLPGVEPVDVDRPR